MEKAYWKKKEKKLLEGVPYIFETSNFTRNQIIYTRCFFVCFLPHPLFLAIVQTLRASSDRSQMKKQLHALTPHAYITTRYIITYAKAKSIIEKKGNPLPPWKRWVPPCENLVLVKKDLAIYTFFFFFLLLLFSNQNFSSLELLSWSILATL